MHLHHLDVSQGIFEKLVELDSQDQIGARGLLELVVKRNTEVAG